MKCTVLKASDPTCLQLAGVLTRPGSEFEQKLRAGKATGLVAMVEEHGRPVGWARTEEWKDPATGHQWDTLEAFVSEEQRMRGVAAFAASGLVSSYFIDFGTAVAVFRPSMMLVAKRVGLHPTLFTRSGDSWVKE